MPLLSQAWVSGRGVYVMLDPRWALDLETEQKGMSGLGEVSVGWVGPASLWGDKSYQRSTPGRRRSEERQGAGPHGESGMGNKERQEVMRWEGLREGSIAMARWPVSL